VPTRAKMVYFSKNRQTLGAPPQTPVQGKLLENVQDHTPIEITD